MWSVAQNVGQFWYNVVKKQRKTGISMGFFYILHQVYIYKHEVVFIEIPEWKLKAKLARSSIFEGNWDKIFAHFGSKMAKSDYFRGFYFR